MPLVAGRLACAEPPASPWKDASWPPRALPPRTPALPVTHPGPHRISFAKIREPLEVPNLLALQTDSFDWLLGNDAWQDRVERRQAAGPTSRPAPASRRSSRRSARSRTSPGTMSPVVPRPPLRAAEELDRGVQGARLHLLRAAVRHRRVHEQRDRRDQEPDGLHGRLPADDRQGHLHHQRHRAGRRVAARPLARASTSSSTVDKTSDKDVFGAKIIPSRGAWLEFEIDKRTWSASALDRKRKQSVTVLLKALGWDDAQILEEFGDYESIRADPGEGPHHRPGRRAARHLPQAASGRAADPRGRADAARQPLLQPEALRPGQGRSLQGQQEARDSTCRCRSGVLTVDDIVATIRYLVSLHAGETDDQPPRGDCCASRSTTSTTSATAACARSAS